MKICERCGKTIETTSKRFCSRKCMWDSRPSKLPKLIEVSCSVCNRQRVIKSWNGRVPIRKCRKCSTYSPSGSDSPVWKGGHHQWSQGRFGKDKDGLSWKAQRKLAWERDNYECQHCHLKKYRKPDVHHINPWMNSQSHALDNLLCLCQSCHLKEEAKVQEVWGGQNHQLFKEDKSQKKSETFCRECSLPRKVDEIGWCKGCKDKKLFTQILGLQSLRLPLRSIALKLNLPNHQVVMRILKTYS